MSVEHPLPVRAQAPPGDEPRAAPKPAAGKAASKRLLLSMLGLVVVWGLLMQRFGDTGNIYAVMGPFGLSVVVVVAALASRRLSGWLRPSGRALLSGLGLGVGMTLLTYPAYALLRALVPGIEPYVSTLYTAAHQTALAEALPWTIAIIVAEEVLWRGALLHALERRVRPPLAMVISVATYTAAQLGTGSWIVALLALVCGTLWTLQRHLTRSLVAPLLAHLIWTPTVILLYPVTSL